MPSPVMKIYFFKSCYHTSDFKSYSSSLEVKLCNVCYTFKDQYKTKDHIIPCMFQKEGEDFISLLKDIGLSDLEANKIHRSNPRRSLFFDSPIPKHKKIQPIINSTNFLSNDKHNQSLFNTIPIIYNDFLFMNEIWNEDLNKIPHLNIEKSILKSDFHGALFTIIKSGCPSFVDVKGIVVMETMNMFLIVSTDNKIRKIPKKGTIFKLDHSELNIFINGNGLRQRIHMRVTKGAKIRKD
eukprot:GHVP01049854.1.p1 GENE.GHVP01049854.1~~GHVP01049854.1.p1  ORF type:complete len:239 (+),score=23.01 GHVP01049854.1:96-812(+)